MLWLSGTDLVSTEVKPATIRRNKKRTFYTQSNNICFGFIQVWCSSVSEITEIPSDFRPGVVFGVAQRTTHVRCRTARASCDHAHCTLIPRWKIGRYWSNGFNIKHISRLDTHLCSFKLFVYWSNAERLLQPSIPNEIAWNFIKMFGIRVNLPLDVHQAANNVVYMHTQAIQANRRE